MRETFKVGDRVIVYNHNDNPLRTHSIKRVIVRFVELSDGSKWTPDGLSPYPRTRGGVGYWTHLDIRLATPERVAQFNRALYLSRLQRVYWDKLPTETLIAVLELAKDGLP